MKRIKLLGVSLIAVVAVLALTASSAMAEEKTKMLPESGVSFTSTSGPGTLETKGGSKVTCTKDKDTGTIDSANLGKFTVDFEGCKLGTEECTGVNEAKEVILMKGVYHFWLALELKTGETKESLVGALVFLIEEFHFTCKVGGIFNALVLVLGCVAALAEPLNTLAEITKDVFKQSKGVQLIILVLPQEAKEEIKCILLSSVNGGAFEQSGAEGTDENKAFKVGEKPVTVLLMNPEALP
jgi:hypothetical protein